MRETLHPTAAIPYARYKAEAARLRSEAIAEAFGRLGRLLGRRGPAASTDRRYRASGAAGWGQ